MSVDITYDSKNSVLLLLFSLLCCLIIFYGLYIYKNVHEGFVDEANCKYFPWGPTKESCVNNCISRERIGLWDSDGKQCSRSLCEYICASCTDDHSCQWISSWSQEEKDKLLSFNKKDSALSGLVPRRLDISAISYSSNLGSEFSGSDPNTKEKINMYEGIKVSSIIKLNWMDHKDADKFMIHYYSLNSQSNMIQVKTIDKSFTEYELQKMESDTEYYIVMYAINQYGVSAPSNIVSIKT